MEENPFNEVEEKIAKQLGCSVEEFQQLYDKEIITSNLNKDDEHLFIFRKIESKEVVKDVYSNNARYTIFSKDGKVAGYITVAIQNSSLANEAEIEYYTSKDCRNKGNITISLEEVLKDIFIDKSFDGLQIKSFFPKTKIQNVFLSISADNYASQAVANKSGFVKKRSRYEMTEEDFLKRIHLTNRGDFINQLKNFEVNNNNSIVKKDEKPSSESEQNDLEKE